MVNSCSAAGCRNRAVKGSDLSFHRFPLRNAWLCKQWLIAIQRQSFKPTRFSYICSAHFQSDDYNCSHLPSESRCRLKPNSIPSLFGFNADKLSTKQSLPPKKRRAALRSPEQQERVNELAAVRERILLPRSQAPSRYIAIQPKPEQDNEAAEGQDQPGPSQEYQGLEWVPLGPGLEPSQEHPVEEAEPREKDVSSPYIFDHTYSNQSFIYAAEAQTHTNDLLKKIESLQKKLRKEGMRVKIVATGSPVQPTTSTISTEVTESAFLISTSLSDTNVLENDEQTPTSVGSDDDECSTTVTSEKESLHKKIISLQQIIQNKKIVMEQGYPQQDISPPTHSTPHEEDNSSQQEEDDEMESSLPVISSVVSSAPTEVITISTKQAELMEKIACLQRKVQRVESRVDLNQSGGSPSRSYSAIRKKVKCLQQRLRRKESKIRQLELTISKLRAEKSQKTREAEELLDTKVSGLTKDLLVSEFRNKGRSHQGRRYNNKVKEFAQILNLYSPAAYKYVRSVLALPCPKSLTKWNLPTDSNEPTAPLDEDATSAEGQMSFPDGQPSNSEGQMSYEEGQISYEVGQMTYSEGQMTYSEPQISSAGVEISSAGVEISQSGVQLSYSNGQPLSSVVEVYTEAESTPMTTDADPSSSSVNYEPSLVFNYVVSSALDYEVLEYEPLSMGYSG